MKHSPIIVLICALAPIPVSAQNMGDTPPSSNSSNRTNVPNIPLVPVQPQTGQSQPSQPVTQIVSGTQRDHSKDNNSAPHFGRLAPEQIQIIQSVGKAVLGAKSSQPKDPEAEAMKAELQALSAELEQATAMVTPAPLTLQGNTPNNTRSPQGGGANANGVSDSVLHARRARLDIQRGQMVAKTRQDGSPERIAMAEARSNKVNELALELDAALAATGGERLTKLSALRQKLQIKTLGDLERERRMRAAAAGTPEEDTPTLTTIVQHR